MSLRTAVQNRLDHPTPHLPRLRKPRLKKLRRPLEPLAIQIKVPKPHALAPPARSHDKLKIICAVPHVVHGRVDRRVQARGRAEEILRDADPEPEDRRRGEQEVHEGVDVERRPAVDHREQREVRVRDDARAPIGVRGDGAGVGGEPPEAELVEDALTEEDLRAPAAFEDLPAGAVEPLAEFLALAFEHELEELRDAFGVLVDLQARGRVQDGKARVDVPFIRVDAEHDVDLHRFDSADVFAFLPRVR